MMKALFFFLFTLTCMAQAIIPAKMYKHTTILENYFRPLRNYTVKLKQLYPFDQLENQLVFYTESNQYSHFSISLNALDQSHYQLIIQSENYKTDIIEFELSQALNLNLNMILDLSFVKQVTNMSYTVSINSRTSSFKSDINENRRITEYVLGSSGTTAYLEEIKDTNLFESTLFYRCAQCGGEILRAIFTSETEAFYRGLDQRLVNDTDFFNRANRFYLSGIFRGMTQLISSRTDDEIWPEVE